MLCKKKPSVQVWEAVDILCNYCKCTLGSLHYRKLHFHHYVALNLKREGVEGKKRKKEEKKTPSDEVIAISKAALELLENVKEILIVLYIMVS